MHDTYAIWSIITDRLPGIRKRVSSGVIGVIKFQRRHRRSAADRNNHATKVVEGTSGRHDNDRWDGHKALWRRRTGGRTDGRSGSVASKCPAGAYVVVAAVAVATLFHHPRWRQLPWWTSAKLTPWCMSQRPTCVPAISLNNGHTTVSLVSLWLAARRRNEPSRILVTSRCLSLATWFLYNYIS